MTTLFIVLGIVALVAVGYAIHRWNKIYVGTEPLEDRLKRVGLELKGDKLTVDGITFTISEYRKVVAGNKRIFTRLEYRYQAPFLRSFHVARRPKEEMAVKLNADVMGEILTGHHLFDSIYVIRSHTREEILEILDEEFFKILVDALQKHEADVEISDSFFRWHVPGPPAFLEAHYFAIHAKSAARLAKVLEKGRSRRPLPEPQATIYSAASSKFKAGPLRRSPDGGAEFDAQAGEGPKVAYVLKHSDDGIHYRLKTLEEYDHAVAISGTTFTVDYPNREFHMRVISSSAHYNVLVPLPIEATGSNAIQAVMRQNKKRLASAYAKRMVEAGILDRMEELLTRLEELTKSWSDQRYPSLEVNSRYVRAYVPGPISETTPLETVHEIVVQARDVFMELHEQVSQQVF